MKSNISKQFEARHIRNISRLSKRLQKAYYNAIDKILKQSGTLSLKNGVFKLSNHPVLKKRIDETLAEFRKEVEVILVNGIKSEWELSIEKNAGIISKALAGKKLSEAVNKIIFDPHTKALESFINIKKNGLGLSDRVWNYSNQFQSEIEQGIFTGLSEGKSAVVMAREQKQYLKEPDNLFRRVRNAEGKLVLSSNAKKFNPGKGVYRSSFKNALRFTRDVTNRSYRAADYERWNSTPFVIGIEIKLSNNHPKFDICDRLVGAYPSSYKHTGFHTQCMCYAVPKLASPEQFDKYEDAVLNGNADNFEFTGVVNEIPENAKTWYAENKERIRKYKSVPYFLADNKKLF